MRPQPVLSGTGRIADDLYLIAHHEVSGRPYLSPRTSGIALAAGLLAELLAAQAPAITLDHGCLRLLCRKNGTPVARHARPEDPISGQVLDLIATEPQPRPVRDWLLFLGKTSAAQVAGRLERAGYLTRPRNRTLWRTPPPVPADLNCSVCALLRARAALGTARPLTEYAAVLAGLVMACGLGFRFSDLPDAPVRSAEEVAQMLHRPLQEFIAHVQLTADAAVLSART
jgi:hypothetical protein